MRISSYQRPDGIVSFGVVEGDVISEASEEIRATYRDVRGLLEAGAAAELKSTGTTFRLGEVSLLPPILQPDKIICIGLNYMSHIKETGRDKPEYPSIFTRYPSSIVGHRQSLVRPTVSDQFDFEGELAVIIGKRTRAVSSADAMKHVAGYTCLNDGSIRDYQRHTTQFWSGKNFVGTGSMGPWLVTADEFGDPATRTLQTRLNGEMVQDAAISDLAFSVPELVAYLSIVTELLPGDVIATGTPGGVGVFRNPKLFMKPGDEVEVDISGIGTLRNTVVAEG
ncbi:fumarylacetoacetate hydrolase family protein [Mesorhizobium sp. J428]|uniref:fumarylacetoacetate hydrolase family protein n=1 Tax=Mesorhizobium sp. J428 TaxID=2898440 RepID=UPI0021515440|nr:fumarylacetoacetate hydrolase family protein [Mesorhizobium sp. J428]MCR5857970.1 fumarylacetoacetate hydrolase family protein [Mesorhizobium sp. J428]